MLLMSSVIIVSVVTKIYKNKKTKDASVVGPELLELQGHDY